VIRFAGNTM